MFKNLFSAGIVIFHVVNMNNGNLVKQSEFYSLIYSDKYFI